MCQVVAVLVGQIGRFRHHVAHRAALEVRQLFVLVRSFDCRQDLRLGTAGHYHPAAQKSDRQYRTCRLRVQAIGGSHLGVPEFGPVKPSHPGSFHHADKPVLAFNGCLVSLPSQNPDRRLAGYGIGSGTSRQLNLGVFSIRYWSIGAILGYGSDCAAALDIPQAMLMTSTKTIVSSDLRLISAPFLSTRFQRAMFCRRRCSLACINLPLSAAGRISMSLHPSLSPGLWEMS